MDIAIQMRSIELMLKFLKHDLKNVPSYGYALQKRELPEAKAPKPLPRSTPEAEGIRSDAVLRFYEAVSAEADSHRGACRARDAPRPRSSPRAHGRLTGWMCRTCSIP